MIVVTGAAGFIGSNIAQTLHHRGERDIVAVDNAAVFARTPYLNSIPLATRLNKEEFLPWLTKNAKAVSAIVHMGACSDTTRTDREFMMENNFEYTRRLWEFCAVHGVRLIYASSAATYGDGLAGYDDELDPRRLKPLNLYGETKQRFDLWALEQKHSPNGWAGLKFFNVYGPNEAHKERMASVVLHSFRQINENGHVRLFKSDRSDYPDGGQKRDFIYVADVVAAVLHFTSAPPAKIGGLFNVGTGIARTFSDLATAVFRALDLPARIEYIAMPEDLRGKYQYFTQATIAKLRASGFTREFHSLEAGVADYVKNHLVRHEIAKGS